MTDSRLPGRWLTDLRFEALSDRAFRTFAGSLMWSNEQGTDGVLPAASMKYLHPRGVDAPTRVELLTAGLWVSQGDAIAVPDWATKMGQSTAEQLQATRENNRERQRKHRASKQGVTRDVTRDVTGESLGQDRQGEDRQGKATYSEAVAATGEVVDWPTVDIPKPDPGYCRVCGGALPCSKTDEKHSAARAAQAAA